METIKEFVRGVDEEVEKRPILKKIIKIDMHQADNTLEGKGTLDFVGTHCRFTFSVKDDEAHVEVEGNRGCEELVKILLKHAKIEKY